MKAVIREVREETGLSISPNTLISVKDYLTEFPRLIRQTIQITFLAKPLSANGVKLNPREHIEFAWINQKAVDGLDLVPVVRATLLEFFRNIY